MDKSKKVESKDEMKRRALKMQKYCDLLIEQCNSWLPPTDNGKKNSKNQKTF
jgi:hypothetical protein